MRTKAVILVVFVATLVLLVAATAVAGQQTRILYGLENYDTYSVTPPDDGYMRVMISWTRSDGTGAPEFPEAEVDGVVQMTNSPIEPYFDEDWQGLYVGTNPQEDTQAVTGGQEYWVSVLPFVGDVPYRLQVSFDTVVGGTFSTQLLDTGEIDVSDAAQKWAYGVDGDVYVPDEGPWHSVLQYWPGAMDRVGGTSDVWANWDEFVFGALDYSTLVENWSGLEYYPPVDPPVVSDETITAEQAGAWYVVCPQIWNSAENPNVWNDITVDNYPKPGKLAYDDAPLWYTYSWPDADKAAAPAYFWGSLTSTAASRHSFSGIGDRSARLEYSFYGDSLTWRYYAFNRGGIANVTIDSVSMGDVDTYAATAGFATASYSGLGNAAHTVVITPTGSKNASSLGYWTMHDAFVAPNYSGDPSLLSENSMDGSTTYRWGTLNASGASGGSWSGTGDRAAALAFTFNATSVEWRYVKFNRGGIARVYIDGVDQGTVDLYASSLTYGSSVTYSDLSSGWHTIFIVSTKTKNASSLGYWTNHDAFVAGGATVEN